MNENRDALERGFDLAHFIFPDRAVAVEILTGAYNKFHSQCSKARKRNYWRDKYLKRGITRISLNDADALQWLICFESDVFEKRQEQAGTQTLRDMVRRFVKTIVRSGTAMSSFYVNVGVGRVLHSYTTAETQRVYEALSERYLGEDEFRRAKRILMNKLEARFSGLLATFRAGYGEIRFEALHEQNQWGDYVQECLTAFTPWSTKSLCLVPANFSSANCLPTQLTGKGTGMTESDAIETNRCHAFIDPACYERLMSGLRLDAPSRKLAVPRFNVQSNQHDSDTPKNSAGLTRKERQRIESDLVKESAHRRGATPQIVHVLVDGEERQQLELLNPGQLHFDITEGAELIEIWAEDHIAGNEASANKNRFLLATHRIRYTEASGFAADSQTVLLRGRMALVLTISPYSITGQETEYRAVVLLKSVKQTESVNAANRVPWLLQWVPAYAFAAALLIVLSLTIVSQRHERTQDRNTIASLEKQLAEKHAALVATETQTTVTPFFRLISDDMITRGTGSQTQQVAISSGQPLLDLQLSVGTNAQSAYQAAVKSFMDDSEIFREGQLKPERTMDGAMVTLPLPTQLLSNGQDYVVELRYTNAAGQLGEKDTFTFHVIKTKD